MPGLDAPTFGAALLLGLFGGVHCVAMCGGIVTALAQRDARRAPRARVWLAPLAYNGARIASYAAVGALAGAFGAGLAQGVGPSGTIALRLALGALFVALGLHVAGIWLAFSGLERVGLAFWRRLAPLARRVGSRDGLARTLALGALWGWLPCGLVYAAAAGAAATGSASAGALLMLGFGLGTLPLLVASGAAAHGLQRWTGAASARRFAAALLAVAGVWTMAGALPHGAAHAHAASHAHAAPPR